MAAPLGPVFKGQGFEAGLELLACEGLLVLFSAAGVAAEQHGHPRLTPPAPVVVQLQGEDGPLRHPSFPTFLTC